MSTRDKPEPLPRLGYPVAEFARALNRTPRWAYRLVKLGQIATFEIGDSMFVPPEEIERLLREGARPAKECA
ncbi:MAG: helix-turn-helix domain-containing protein [Methylocystis sp.]